MLDLQTLPFGMMTIMNKYPLPVSEHRAGAKHKYKTMKILIGTRAIRSAKDMLLINPKAINQIHIVFIVNEFIIRMVDYNWFLYPAAPLRVYHLPIAMGLINNKLA